MITSLVIVSVTITVISFLLVCQPSRRMHRRKHKEQISQLFSTDNEFLLCGDPIPYTAGYIQPIEVLYHDPYLPPGQQDLPPAQQSGILTREMQ